MLDRIVKTWESVLYHLEQQSRHRGLQLSRLVRAELHSEYTYQLSEIHVIDFIERTKNPNVTVIAAHLNMTRGAISKIMSKLLDRGDVVSFRQPDNQKNIYFQLTTRGEAVAKVHRIFHERAQTQIKELFSRYSAQELQIIQRFLSDVTTHVDLTLSPNSSDVRQEES